MTTMLLLLLIIWMMTITLIVMIIDYRNQKAIEVSMRKVPSSV